MGIIGYFAFCFIVLLFGLVCGAEIGEVIFKDDLVKEGKAEYYLDSNNDKKWRLK